MPVPFTAALVLALRTPAVVSDLPATTPCTGVFSPACRGHMKEVTKAGCRDQRIWRTDAGQKGKRQSAGALQGAYADRAGGHRGGLLRGSCSHLGRTHQVRAIDTHGAMRCPAACFTCRPLGIPIIN